MQAFWTLKKINAKYRSSKPYQFTSEATHLSTRLPFFIRTGAGNVYDKL